MSLIVARYIDDEVFAVADTKFSIPAENDSRLNSEGYRANQSKEYIGGLKIILLNPGLFVGFAGNVDFAKNAIEHIYDKGINLFDKNQMIDYFLDHHKKSTGETDFIVGVIVEKDGEADSFEKEIFKISNNQVIWEKHAAHIGDEEAFSKFQECFHNGKNNNSIPTFEICHLGDKEISGFHRNLTKSMAAMRSVIEDSQISAVDGVSTVVISEGNQFRYVEYVQVRGNPIPITNQPNSPISFGGASSGADEKHVGIFSGVGHGVFPVYYMTGKFGVIYHPESSFEPIICNYRSSEDFIESVKSRIDGAHEKVLKYQNRIFGSNNGLFKS
jgi:hypothetical protein